MKYLVLDTNILLMDANNLLLLGGDDITIVLPETVIDELDSKKSLLNDLGYQAREFARLLSKADLVAVSDNPELNYKDVELSLYGVTIIVRSMVKYTPVDDKHIRNDRKILDVANSIKDAIFVSNDVMARLRATSMGIATKQVQVVERLNYRFVKTLEVDYDTHATVNNKKVTDTDPEHEPENHFYIITTEQSAYTKLVYIENGLMKVIGDEKDKEFNHHRVKPQNTNQKFFSLSILDTNTDIVVCDAKAGSGKTLIALSTAMRLVDLGKFSGITYIRNSVDDVPKEEQVGFLSGNEEKFAVYFHPLYDSLEFMARESLKKKKLNPKELEEEVSKLIDEFIQKYNIHAVTGLGLRGRTFHGELIIWDEAQNASAGSAQKILTRVGKNSKVVAIGSNRQIDNPYITKYTNGLSVLLSACAEEHDTVKLKAVELSKVVRSDIAEFAEKLYTKKEKNEQN